jgi:exodeoxyribonuclease VII small subunit
MSEPESKAPNELPLDDDAADTAGEPHFEDVLSRLEKIVARLEQDPPALEESLALFSEGMDLARKGETILSAAEARVEKIVGLKADGMVETVPMEE